jgi:hypothetical protein
LKNTKDLKLAESKEEIKENNTMKEINSQKELKENEIIVL